MRFTDHRRQILDLLVTFRFLTTIHLYGVLGARSDGDQRAVRAVLTRFVQTGLLWRKPLVTDESFEGRVLHWQYLYGLSKRGHDRALAEGLDPEEIGAPAGEISPLMLGHEVGITEVHLQLAAAEPDLFFRRTDLRHTFSSGHTSLTLNPDALFYLPPFYYFLEIEKSKVGNFRDHESGLVRKLRKYAAYADPVARPYREKWPGMEGFFVLVQVANGVRARNLLAALSDVLPVPFVLVHAEDRGDVIGPSWQTARDLQSGTFRSLTDPVRPVRQAVVRETLEVIS